MTFNLASLKPPSHRVRYGAFFGRKHGLISLENPHSHSQNDETKTYGVRKLSGASNFSTSALILINYGLIFVDVEG